MNKDFIVSLSFTTSEIDVILNALEEKNISIKNLYDTIYNEVYSQIKLREEFKVMENKTIICKDCGKEFEYTVGEQKFFEERGFSAPIRCKECRAAKKTRNEENKNDLEEMLKKLQENTVSFN